MKKYEKQGDASLIAIARHIVSLLLSSDQVHLPALSPFIAPALEEINRRSELNTLQRLSEFCQSGNVPSSQEASARKIVKLMFLETDHEFGLHKDDLAHAVELAKKMNGKKPSVQRVIRHFEEECSVASASWLEILSNSASSTRARRLAAASVDRVWAEIDRREQAMSSRSALQSSSPKPNAQVPQQKPLAK